MKERSCEDINRIIAEWHGWEFIPTRDVYSSHYDTILAVDEEWRHYDLDLRQESLPDYCNDLNLIHLAEKKLSITLPAIPYTDSDRSRYVLILESTCGSKGMVMATALERSEAIVQIIETPQ